MKKDNFLSSRRVSESIRDSHSLDNRFNINRDGSSYKINDVLFRGIKEILVNNNVKLFDSDQAHAGPGLTGWLIRNGQVYLSECGLLTLQHELAHIVLIKNPTKHLIDNWGFPLVNTPGAKSFLKFMLIEARVWGVENFITGHFREINRHWLSGAVNDKDNNLSQKELLDKITEICNTYTENMTTDLFLSMLDSRLNYVSNHIKNNPGFSSKEFYFAE